ncbi:MAG TPA: hypothetical protein VN578_04905 [Candidatus Binatia bacterium]|nr:hypothetical protein [Candidatus Binatia bacterium]
MVVQEFYAVPQILLVASDNNRLAQKRCQQDGIGGSARKPPARQYGTISNEFGWSIPQRARPGPSFVKGFQ